MAPAVGEPCRACVFSQGNCCSTSTACTDYSAAASILQSSNRHFSACGADAKMDAKVITGRVDARGGTEPTSRGCGKVDLYEASGREISCLEGTKKRLAMKLITKIFRH